MENLDLRDNVQSRYQSPSDLSWQNNIALRSLNYKKKQQGFTSKLSMLYVKHFVLSYFTNTIFS